MPPNTPHGDDLDRTRELPAYLDPRGLPDDRTRYQEPVRDDRRHRRPEPGPYAADPYRDQGYQPDPYRPGEQYGYQPHARPPVAGRPAIGQPAPPVAPGRRRRRFGAGKVIALLLTALLLLVAGFVVYLDMSLNREDVLTDYEGRPADTPGTTWLLVGSDSRDDLTEQEQSDLATGYTEGKRTDTIMLLHVPDSDAAPSLVSLPRDTLVTIDGHGQQKLNAAFSFGGGSLLVRTVETTTGLRIDRYAEIGFGGFAGIVDAVGGVDMCLDEPMNDPLAGLDLPAGCQTLSGAQALGYVRTRASANADLDRVERQREFLGALLSKAASFGSLANPFRSVPLALETTGTLIVDDGAHLWHLASMGLAMADDALVTTTAPVAGTPTIDGVGSVVIWDETAAQALFAALAADQAIPAELLAG